jgi:hypothetical protein
MPTWTCPLCQEKISDAYRLCWRCGADREGRVDPAMQVKIQAARDVGEPADDGPLAERPPRRTWKLTLGEIVALAVVAGVFLLSVLFQQALATWGLRLINFVAPPISLAVLLVLIASIISRWARE